MRHHYIDTVRKFMSKLWRSCLVYWEARQFDYMGYLRISFILMDERS